MFSSALKSFTSNISNNYQISPNPSFISGPWRVHDGKKKGTGASASVFIFDRKSLDPRAGGFGSRSNSSSLKKVHEEVIARLNREASNLARLRHPSILQLLEPVEETRNGGLMFVTEPVTTSLAGLLKEKDDQERTGGTGGRASRFMVEEPDGSRRRRDIEIDELEIQKGLLQIGKGLEFLHESAKLVHGNLTPESIYINSKSDWKISGLSFTGPADSGSQSTLPPLALSEVLHYDSRLPRSVQLDLDYSSPDFVMDSNISPHADLFSLGLIVIALYNSPHTSPLHTNNNINTYKKLLGSPSTIPSLSNSFLSSRAIPKDLTTEVLPKLITRRPAQRMNASEFQQSQYFDNVLVSTIRFLDSFPAKTPNEKPQFMRGLARILPEFPSSVLERKVLGALLDQSKDRELLPLILQNVFKIVKSLPSSRRVVPEKVIPHLKEIFLSHVNKTSTHERDNTKDTGLMVVLENMRVIAENCSGKDFKDDVLPLIHLGLESPTHSLIDASMRCLPAMLPVLDFSTVKDDVFPPIASVFSKTSSLAIKVRGLEAFSILCGGSIDTNTSIGGLSEVVENSRSTKTSSSSVLDKFTIQEKLVPLLKAMKTKEPAVMMAGLNVFRQVGQMADVEFIALEVLPILWSFSLGPLLNVQQFTSFMELIKSLSSKVEREQTKKLQQLASANDSTSFAKSQTAGLASANGGNNAGTEQSDFESLVLGKIKAPNTPKDSLSDLSGLSVPSMSPTKPDKPANFSWSSSPVSYQEGNSRLARPAMNSRSVTPDMNINAFPPLQPGSISNTSHSSFSAPQMTAGTGAGFNSQQQTSTRFASANAHSGIPPTFTNNTVNKPQQSSTLSAFSIPPPPPYNSQPSQTFSTSKPTSQSGSTQQQKQGLDKYESLL